MICYKDMTFCHGDGCQTFAKCPVALTHNVQVAARKWWGKDKDIPIATMGEPRELDCYVAPDKEGE